MLIRLPDGTCDTETGVVRRGATVQTLTAKERELLAYLACRPGEVVPTDELLREVWGYAPTAETRAVFHTCRRLRAKIEPDPTAPTVVLAERSVGYRLVVEVVRPAEAKTEASPSPLRPPPAERNRFFGREPELADLVRRFERGDRLVTLVGIGGIGKTRLASHFARDRWSGRTAFADLVAARTEADVAAALLLAIGASPSLDDPPREIAERLGDGLLVVDNAESALALTAAMVGACLDRAPEVRVLVTSRAPLGIPGESRVTLFGLETQAATALVDARAEGEVGDRAALDAVVARLGGIPLALELAAARTSLLGPGALRALLDERAGQEAWLRVLADPAGGERHGQMTAVLEGTCSLLPPGARAALGGLSVFEGGFSLPAAEAVVGDVGTVGVLVRAALVRRVGEARFTMLPPVQAYARGVVSEGELAAARDRHAAWVGTWLGTAGRTVAEQSADRANLVAACEWAIATRHAEVGRLIGTAWTVHNVTGPMRRSAELATAALRLDGLPAADVVPIARAAMFGLRRIGDLTGALAASARLATAARECGDRGAVAQALSVAGYLHYIRGEHAVAAAELEEADQIVEGVSGTIRAGVKARLGALRRAEGRWDEALALFTAAKDLYPDGSASRANSWCRVADLHLLRGDIRQATAACDQAEAAWTEGVEHQLEVLTLRMQIASESGAHARAAQLAQELLQAAIETGDGTTQMRARVTLSTSCSLLGRTDEALAVGRVAAGSGIAGVRHQAVALVNLAWVEERAGLAGAEGHLGHAEALLGDAPATFERRELCGVRADIALLRGDPDGAREWLRRAESFGPASFWLERDVRARLGEPPNPGSPIRA